MSVNLVRLPRAAGARLGDVKTTNREKKRQASKDRMSAAARGRQSAKDRRLLNAPLPSLSAGYQERARHALNDDVLNPQINLAAEPVPDDLPQGEHATWRRLRVAADAACRAAGKPPRRTDLLGFRGLVGTVAFAELLRGRPGLFDAETAKMVAAAGADFYLGSRELLP